MKKIITTVILSLAALSAQAVEVKWVSVGGEYGNATNLKTQRDASSLSASFLVGLSNGVVLEARNRTQQADSTDKAAYGAPLSWQEVGASKRFNVGITNVYGKGLIGMHSSPGVRYAYSATEVGITDQFGKSPFGYTIGYRWIDSLNNRELNGAQNEQMRTQVHYNINKKHRVHVRHQKQTGDTPVEALILGYSYRF